MIRSASDPTRRRHSKSKLDSKSKKAPRSHSASTADDAESPNNSHHRQSHELNKAHKGEKSHTSSHKSRKKRSEGHGKSTSNSLEKAEGTKEENLSAAPLAQKKRKKSTKKATRDRVKPSMSNPDSGSDPSQPTNSFTSKKERNDGDAAPQRASSVPAPPLFKFSKLQREEANAHRDFVFDMVCASAGDSVAFLVRQVGGKMQVETDLTISHNPLNAAELERVLEAGCFRAESGYIRPPPTSGFGQNRIAMTRALGHKYFSQYGIIPDPHTVVRSLPRDYSYLVVCSDGVSDVLNPHIIADIIKGSKWAETGNLPKLAEAILADAMVAWKKFSRVSSPKVEADNASVIVIDLARLFTHVASGRSSD